LSDYDNGEIGRMKIGRGNQSTRRKPTPVPLCPPQTPHAAQMRTRAAAVGSQRLTARATARPSGAMFCLYKENNKLRDRKKKCIYSTYSPLSSTHLWLRCSKFFNPSKKNSFGCAANRKIGNRKSQRLSKHPYVYTHNESVLPRSLLCT
jgi:hypothetical protein